MSDVKLANGPIAGSASGSGLLRRMALFLLLILALGAAGRYGWTWWQVGRFIETTDDSYLQADNVTIAPKVGGIVTRVAVEDNQAVKTGDLLVEIDERDYRIALDQAVANVQSAEADQRNLAAQAELQQSLIDQAVADLASSRAALQFAEQERARYGALSQTGNGSVQRLQQADSDLRSRQAAVSHAQASLEAARKQITIIETQAAKADANLAANRARQAQAALDLEHTRLLAPSDGVIGNKSVRVGQFIQPGTKLLTVVPVQDTYLVANFKETQLARMRPGQPVTLDIDSFPDLAVTGTVQSLAPGSGSQFSLLPPENATGNFTKIVQRVPVKIRLDRNPAWADRLRPGLSVSASVDTRDAVK